MKIKKKELRRIIKALDAINQKYIELVDSGDAGNWNPRLVNEVEEATELVMKYESRAFK